MLSSVPPPRLLFPSLSLARVTLPKRSFRWSPPRMDKQTAVKAGLSNPSTGDRAEAEAEEVAVQYVVLRRDLIDSWPLGSVVTQGCHASVAAVWAHKDDAHTIRYCSDANIDTMHKVTLEVKGEAQMVKLSEKLREGGIKHKLWVEQPENTPTCIATKPYPKAEVAAFFKNLKLCK